MVLLKKQTPFYEKREFRLRWDVKLSDAIRYLQNFNWHKYGASHRDVYHGTCFVLESPSRKLRIGWYYGDKYQVHMVDLVNNQCFRFVFQSLRPLWDELSTSGLEKLSLVKWKKEPRFKKWKKLTEHKSTLHFYHPSVLKRFFWFDIFKLILFTGSAITIGSLMPDVMVLIIIFLLVSLLSSMARAHAVYQYWCHDKFRKVRFLRQKLILETQNDLFIIRKKNIHKIEKYTGEGKGASRGAYGNEFTVWRINGDPRLQFTSLIVEDLPTRGVLVGIPEAIFRKIIPFYPKGLT